MDQALLDGAPQAEQGGVVRPSDSPLGQGIGGVQFLPGGDQRPDQHRPVPGGLGELLHQRPGNRDGAFRVAQAEQDLGPGLPEGRYHRDPRPGRARARAPPRRPDPRRSTGGRRFGPGRGCRRRRPGRSGWPRCRLCHRPALARTSARRAAISGVDRPRSALTLHRLDGLLRLALGQQYLGQPGDGRWRPGSAGEAAAEMLLRLRVIPLAGQQHGGLQVYLRRRIRWPASRTWASASARSARSGCRRWASLSRSTAGSVRPSCRSDVRDLQHDRRTRARVRIRDPGELDGRAAAAGQQQRPDVRTAARGIQPRNRWSRSPKISVAA